jgi:hypothetical protein
MLAQRRILLTDGACGVCSTVAGLSIDHAGHAVPHTNLGMYTNLRFTQNVACSVKVPQVAKDTIRAFIFKLQPHTVARLNIPAGHV